MFTMETETSLQIEIYKEMMRYLNFRGDSWESNYILPDQTVIELFENEQLEKESQAAKSH